MSSHFILKTCFVVLLLTATISCNRLQGVCFVPALPGYNNQPENTVLLQKSLREISGISYHNPEELAAINDEQGKLFILNSKTGKTRTINFGKKGDYEDIVRTPEGYYILRSDGNLYLIDELNGQLLNSFPLHFSKHTEFESLCYDKVKNRILLICKTCGREEPVVYGWEFSLDTHTLNEEPVLRIGWEVFRRLGKDNTIEFQPSATAFHPITNELFILSSTAKTLAICDSEGNPKAVYGLNPDLFQQPEGLCFSPNGDLYISNEGRQSKATLLNFPYQPAVPDKISKN